MADLTRGTGAQPERVERKLAAILAADVVGYSRLMAVDEAGTHARLKALRKDFIEPAIAARHGRIVKLMGDGALVEFASVVDAVQCALEIQRGVAERTAGAADHQRIRFRIGINLGDVIIEGDDIYGDGVNIAARLESLADGGGISISGTAYDQIEGKLPLDYDFMGQHVVKNIARPVRVYRIRLDSRSTAGPSPKSRRASWRRRPLVAAIATVVLLLAGWAGWRWLGTPESARLPLPDKPSVAVLPFSNLSQDPTQEYFSDGVTEDLITGLSKVSGLFVIARNSVFTYKGRPVKVREVGRDLGVRYVLEGGVQRAGSRVRITAQLVDASTGYHVWAERYDREVGDIFALQDEVTQQIVRALAVKLSEGEKVRLARAPIGVPEAYDLVLRGHEARRRTTREGNAEARRLFVRALDLDPAYASAYAGLSWTHLQSWQFLWTTDRDSLERARELAERALALNDTLVDAYRLLGQIYLWQKQHERAIAQAERAVTLAPNDADGYETLAEILGWSGRAPESMQLIRQAMRLNPHYPVFYVWTLGHGYYLMERRKEALDAFSTIAKQNPNFVPAHAYRAVVLTELGRMKEAREAWAKASEISPGASMSNIRERLPYKRGSDLDRTLTAVHKLGMP